MRLNKDQVELISETFADLAKILFGSAVVGFFIPSASGTIGIVTFMIGASFSAGFFAVSVVLLK